MKIKAAQHVYGSVEKELSPRGRRGFQTVFQTAGVLEERDLLDMESRFAYYRQKESRPVKRLFFKTPTGLHVVSRMIGRDGSDAMGRGGLSFAHSAVLTTEEFERAGADPFAILRSFPFAQEWSDVLALGDRSTFQLPMVEFGLKRDAAVVSRMQEWSPTHLEQTLLRALRAARSQEDRDTLLFLGSPDEVASAIEEVLAGVPPPLIGHASFDTWFYRCNVNAVQFWAVGLEERPVWCETVVDARSRHIEQVAPGTPSTCYERWAVAMVGERSFASLERDRAIAWDVCELLEGRSGPMVDVEDELADSVFRSCPSQTAALVASRLREALPASLLQRFGQGRPGMGGRALLDCLRRGFEPGRLADRLYAQYLRAHLEMKPGELEELDAFLRAADHPGLRTVSRWHHGDAEGVDEQLALLTDSEWRKFVAAACRQTRVDSVLLWEVAAPGKSAKGIDEELLLAIVEACPDQVGAELTTRLREALPSVLGRRLESRVRAEFARSRAVAVLRSGFDLAELAHLLFQDCLRAGGPIDAGELDELERLALESGNAGLGTFVQWGRGRAEATATQLAQAGESGWIPFVDGLPLSDRKRLRELLREAGNATPPELLEYAERRSGALSVLKDLGGRLLGRRRSRGQSRH